MTKEELFARVKDILVSEFECDAARITPEARLFEDLDLDSIDAIDLVVRLQQATSLKVSADDFRTIRTLGDVVDVISTLLEKQRANP